MIRLPYIVNPVIIDAQTTPENHPTQQVTLTQSAVVADQFVGNGLVFTWDLRNVDTDDIEEVSSSGSEVRGLTVKFFADHGIVIDRVSHVELKGVSVYDNGRSGVMISGQAAHHNSITGSIIGNDDVAWDLRNKKYGVLIQNGAHDNTIGSPSSRNTITGNGEAGVFIVNSNNNVINGNIIGLKNDGATFANRTQDIGVYVYSNSTGNRIGSQVALAGGNIVAPSNVISGQRSHGVLIAGTSNRVQGNFIGTDLTGLLKRGNGGSGVVVANNDNTIGGEASEANVISGNGGDGVTVNGEGTTNNTVSRNRVGLGNDGTTKIGNNGFGISLQAGTSGNTIIKNVVKENKKAGIPDEDKKNFLLENITAANIGLGIDIGIAGVTTEGMPVINSAFIQFGTTTATVTGSLLSTPASTFLIEIYGNTVPDESGHGEGEFFLGTVEVTTNGAGYATFTASVEASEGLFITATATDLVEGGTSEFAFNVVAFTPGAVQAYVFIDYDGNGIADYEDVNYTGADIFVFLQLEGGNNGGPTYFGVVDSNGMVTFENVMAGSYTLSFTPPVGYAFTLQDQGINDYADSDVNSVGMTDPFILTPGEWNFSFAAGLIPLFGNG